MSHKQLAQEQRYQIYALKKAGVKDTEIANIIQVHKSTVCREIKRNIRQYFPKKSSFAAITAEDIELVMECLNNRPRKCLGFKTHNGLFLGT